MKQVIKFKNGDSWITAGSHIGQFEVKIAQELEVGDRRYDATRHADAVIVSGPHRDYLPNGGGTHNAYLVKFEFSNSDKTYHEVADEKELLGMRPVG